MENILSYQPGSRFTGAKLNEWLRDQIKHHKSHYDEAYRISQHYTFRNEVTYELRYLPLGPGQDQCRETHNQIGFLRVCE